MRVERFSRGELLEVFMRVGAESECVKEVTVVSVQLSMIVLFSFIDLLFLSVLVSM